MVLYRLNNLLESGENDDMINNENQNATPARATIEDAEKIGEIFFIRRFGEARLKFEKKGYYFDEWVSRIVKGSAYVYGDLETCKILEEMKNEGLLDFFPQERLHYRRE